MTVGTVFPRSVGNVTLEGPYPVAASTSIVVGQLVAVTAAGYAVPAADTANHLVAGIANKAADNSTGANGAITVEVATGSFFLTTASAAIADIGDLLYITDATTVNNADPGNTVKAGRMVGFVSATEVVVYIPSGLSAASL